MNFFSTVRQNACFSLCVLGMVVSLLGLITLPVYGQVLYDTYADGNFTASPVWGGDTGNWQIVTNSDVSTGATGSNTLRLNGPAVSQTDYLSTQISTWGTSQEWGFWIGRRAQAYTAANQAYFWLYANESDLNSATVDGYRIAIGDDSGGDEIRLEYIVNGAVNTTVITSSVSLTNGLTDIGFLIRVTRSSTGGWELFTSTLPTTSGTGAIATAVPSPSAASISQGTGTNNSLVPAANGYIGVAALHSTGATAIIAAEFDQIYFSTNADYFRSNVTGDWQTVSTWQSSANNTDWYDAVFTPTPTANTITIRSPHTVTSTGALSIDQVTVNSGATLATNATLINGGNLNISGSFRINQGGFATGVPFVYSGNSTLIFNTTSTYGVDNSHVYWPATDGPNNVTVQGSGGISLSNGAIRTVEGTFRTFAGVGQAGSGALTCNGECEIRAGGFFLFAPTYGSASTLIYNTGGNYGRTSEWSDNDNSNPGLPNNVIIRGSTTLNYPNGTNQPRYLSGNLTIEGGSALYMDFASQTISNPLRVAGQVFLFGGALSLGSAIGGDIYVGGDWREESGATFIPNNRGVFLNGAGTQTISRTGGTNSFPFLLIDKTTGSVALSNDVTVSSVLTFQNGNTANISTGANSLIISNNNVNAIVRTGGGHVIGNLRRAVTGNNTYDFPIGTSAGYTPVSVAFTGASGNLTANSNDGPHPNFATYGLSAMKYVNRHWNLTGSSFTSANATFAYLPADLTGGALAANIKAAKFDGGTWTLPATTTGTNSFTATGLTSFSGFMGGETPPDYEITTTGNAIVITDISGNGETLNVSESGSNIRFVVTPTTRTYSIDGGPTTAFTIPADVALAGANSITIHTGGGNDAVLVNISANAIPDITIHGGAGNLDFSGSLTNNAASARNLTLTSDGNITLSQQASGGMPLHTTATAMGNITVGNAGFRTNGGSFSASGVDITITGGGLNTTLTGGMGGSVSLELTGNLLIAQTGVQTGGGDFSATGAVNITITDGGLSTALSGDTGGNVMLELTGNLLIQSSGVQTGGGSFSATGGVDITITGGGLRTTLLNERGGSVMLELTGHLSIAQSGVQTGGGNFSATGGVNMTITDGGLNTALTGVMGGSVMLELTGNLLIQSSGVQTGGGNFSATGSVDVTITDGGLNTAPTSGMGGSVMLELTGNLLIQSNGVRTGGGDFSATGGVDITITGGGLNTTLTGGMGGSVTLALTGNLLIEQTGVQTGGGDFSATGGVDITITGGGLSTALSGDTGGNVTLTLTGNLLIQSSGVRTGGGDFSATGSVDVTITDGGLNTALTGVMGGSVTLALTGNLLIEQTGVQTGGGDFSATGGVDITITGGGLNTALSGDTGGNVTLTLTGNLLIQSSGVRTGGGDFSATGGMNMTITDGGLNTALSGGIGGSVTLALAGNLLIQSSGVQTGGGDFSASGGVDITITGGGLNTALSGGTGGNVTLGLTGNLLIQSGGVRTGGGDFSASGGVDITITDSGLNTAPTSGMGGSVMLELTGNLLIQSNGVRTGGGDFSATGGVDITITGGGLNTALTGSMGGSVTLALTGNMLIAQTGVQTGGGDFSATGGVDITITGGGLNTALTGSMGGSVTLALTGNLLIEFNGVQTGGGNFSATGGANITITDGGLGTALSGDTGGSVTLALTGILLIQSGGVRTGGGDFSATGGMNMTITDGGLNTALTGDTGGSVMLELTGNLLIQSSGVQTGGGDFSASGGVDITITGGGLSTALSGGTGGNVTLGLTGNLLIQFSGVQTGGGDFSATDAVNITITDGGLNTTLSGDTGGSVTLELTGNLLIQSNGVRTGGGDFSATGGMDITVKDGGINVATTGGSATVNIQCTGNALLDTGNGIQANGNVSVAAGALEIKSTINTTSGTVTINTPNGTSPKHTSPEVIATSLAFTSGSKLKIAINGATIPNTDYDQLGVSGTVNLTGVNLVLSGSHMPTIGETFTIVANDGTDAIVGTFQGLLQGASISNFLGSGLNATITYTGGTGNDVVLTVVPACPDLSATPANVTIVNSSCGSGCTLTGGSISAPTGMPCPEGSTLQYQVNGGSWSTIVPTYNQTTPVLNIRTRCACDNDAGNVSEASAPVSTVPGTLANPVVPANGSATVACPDLATQPTPPAVTACDGSPITPTGPVVDNSPNPLTCEGTRTYTWTYTCGSTSSVWSFVYAIERQPFTVPANGSAVVSSPDLATQPTPPVVTSNCGETLTPTGPAVTDDPNPIVCTGTRTYAWTYTDCEGNTAVWSFVYTIIDNTPPTVTCSNQAITFNGQPSIALNANDLVTASDNCGIASITLSPDVIECDRVGQVVPVTVTVMDVNTNVSTCTANVTVGGLPCGWSQNADGVNCNNGNSIAFNPATAVWTATSTNCYYAPPFSSDSHGFAQRQLCGNNGSITVRIDNINGQGWAGIVMRESNAPGAKKAQLMTNLSSFNRMEFRAITDAQAYPQQIPFSNRRWLRIVRTGNQFQMFTSLNGTTWQFAGAQNIVMANCIQVGLVLTNFSANNTVSATFSMLEVQGSNVPLGLPGNGVAELAPHLSPLTPDFSPLTPDFSVFPNPTSGELNLDLTQYVGRSVRIETYSSEGKLLQFREVDEMQTTLERLDLKGFQSGMYLVKVKSAGLPDVTRRVVKQ